MLHVWQKDVKWIPVQVQMNDNAAFIFKRLFSKLVILLRNAVIEQVSSEHVNDPEVITELSQSSLDVDHNLLCTTS